MNRIKKTIKVTSKSVTMKPSAIFVSNYKYDEFKWDDGEVYAYQFLSEESEENNFYKKYIYLVKVGEIEWNEGLIAPMFYAFKRLDVYLTEIESLVECEYLHLFYDPVAYVNFPNKKPLYLLAIPNATNGGYPKKHLTYLGKINNVKRIADEELVPCFIRWKNLEAELIYNYLNWN